LPEGCKLSLVDTKLRGERNIFDCASVSFAELFRTIHIFSSLVYQLIINRPKLVHLSCSLSPAGITRDLGCAVIARIFRVPIISHYHGNLPDFHYASFYGLSGFCLRALLRIAKINIVENQMSLRQARQINQRVDGIVLLPNFIEDEIFAQKRTISQSRSSRYQALFIGGITRAKGCAEILSIAQLMPEIDFHLFGKMHDDMAPLYAHAPKNIILHGTVQHDVLLNEMAKNDFLLFPSYSEGFPLSVLEAMAVGLPVIATKVGAIPEMIDEGLGGFLVEPRDVSSMVSAIKAFIMDPKLKSSMGTYNAEKSYHHYRSSIVMAKMLKIYNQLAAMEPAREMTAE
jgi:glycosyltransferase involved in cell wall biosynthesis